MIIPIRCFTCGKLLANLWETYQLTLQTEINNLKDQEKYKIDIDENTKKSIEHAILNKMGITRYCCRRMMISHVDLCDKI